MLKATTHTFASFFYKEFSLFVISKFLMTVAFSIQFIVVEWKVYELTNSALNLGLIGLAEIIPAFSFSFISGHIIDKNEKRKSVLLCIFFSFFISILLGFSFSFYFLNRFSIQAVLPLIYLLIFMFGIIRAFFTPANFSLFSLVLPKENYTNGTTWAASAWQLGAVIGPAVGGFLYVKFGAQNSLLFSSLLIFISFVVIFKINKKPIYFIPTESILKSLSLGFNFIFLNKALLSALLLDMFAVLFGGAVTLIPIFAKDILQVGADGAGILRASPAVGAIIIMFLLAKYPIKNKPGLKLLYFVFGFGLCIIGFGLSKNIYLSIFFLVMSGIFDGVSVVLRSTILQVLTPNDLRGRVSAINSMFVGSSNELGAFESGLSAKILGPVIATISGGFITLLIVIIVGLKSPKLKNLEIK
ncbi:MAG: MFS transporter [Solirubrobacteraceae bacterium]